MWPQLKSASGDFAGAATDERRPPSQRGPALCSAVAGRPGRGRDVKDGHPPVPRCRGVRAYRTTVNWTAVMPCAVVSRAT